MLNYTEKMSFLKKKPPGRVTNKNDKPSVFKRRPPAGSQTKKTNRLFSKKNIPSDKKKLVKSRQKGSCRKNQIVVRPKNTFSKFSKESGLNSGSKFLVGRKEPTRVSGFVLIRLGARAMNFFFRKLLKSEPPRRRGITRVLLVYY